jgi:hypothetical protein
MAWSSGTFRLTGVAVGLSVVMTLGTALRVEAVAPKPRATDGTRSLHIVAVPQQSLGVMGSGWSRSSVLTVSAWTSSPKRTIKLKTTAHGTFLVGISSITACADFTFTAHDATHHLTVQRLPRACAVDAGSGPPVITVLQGKQMTARQITIDVSQPLPAATMHVGDVLYLYDPSSQGTSVLVRGDPDHLRLIDQGAVPACPPDANCPTPSGVFWRFTATHSGESIVIVSAACRQSKPPCMVPDRALRIQILP